MSDVFISYAREDSRLVRRLYEALEASRREVWVDWEGIPPTAEWLEEIYAAIDSANTFIFVLSPDSLASATCAKELEHAVRNNKRLLPVVGREAGEAPVAEALARLNWIFLRDDDDFAAGFETLIEALDTDLEHVKLHTRYLKRAVDWQRRERDKSLALRGSELRAAEEWLAASGDKEPRPTSLHNRFLLESRRAATRRQRTVIGSVAGGVLVALVLGILSVQQRNEKRRQRQLNIARQLVAQSNLAREERQESLERSVQLAAEAMRRLDALAVPSLDADQALRRSLALLPSPPESDSLEEPLGDIRAAATAPGGRYLAIAKERGHVLVWDQVERRLAGEWQVEVATPGSFRAIAINAGGDRVLTGVSNGPPRSRVSLWAVAAGREVAACELDDDLGIAARYEVSSDGRHWIHGPRLRRLADCQEAEIWGGELVVSALTLSADGRRIAASLRRRGARERWIEIRDLADGGEIGRWPHEGRLRLQFLDGDRRLAGLGGSLTIWDLDDPGRPPTLEMADPISALSGDGRYLVTRGKPDSVAMLRSAATGEELLRLVHPNRVRAAAFSPDGRHLTTFTEVDHHVRRWRLQGAEGLVSRAPGRRVAFSVDGRFLAAAGDDAVRVWSLAEGAEVARLAAAAPAAALAFAGQPPSFTGETSVLRAGPDGWQLVPPPAPGAAPLAGAALPALAEREQIHAVAPCPDERRLAITSGRITRAGWEARSRVWDAASHRQLVTFDLVDTAGGGMKGLSDQSVGLLACSSDGRYLAAPANDAAVIWDLASQSLLTRLPHPALTAMAFDPSGGYVATAGRGPARIWQLAASLEVARLLDGAAVASLAFSPDGRWLATAGQRGVGLWLWRPRDLVAEACARLPSELPAAEWGRLFAGEPYAPTCPPAS